MSTSTVEQLRAAAAFWKGRTRPEGGTDSGEVAVERCYGDNWHIYVGSLDGSQLLERLADQWPEEVISVTHDPEHGTNLVVKKAAYCLHSGVRRKHEMSEENRAAAGIRLARARGLRGHDESEGGEE